MSFMSHIAEVFTNVGTIGLAVSLLLSLVNCFFGYKLMKVWIAAAGFVIGFVLGDVVCALLRVESYGIFFFIGAVVGIVLGVLSFKFYKVGIFLLGGVLGGGIAALVLGIDGSDWWHVLAAVAVGTVVGCLTLLASKPVVILTSAISGGLASLRAVSTLFAITTLTGDSTTTLLLVGGIVLAGFGVLVQFITNRSKPEPTEQV